MFFFLFCPFPFIYFMILELLYLFHVFFFTLSSSGSAGVFLIGIFLHHCCLQILVQHIRRVLPGFKARINVQMVALAKELASLGEITESKVSLVHITVL